MVENYVAQVNRAPTHVMDIYKIRSGRFKGVKIWYYFNLGNGDRQDLFITDQDNKLLEFEDYELIESYDSFAEKLSQNDVNKILLEEE